MTDKIEVESISGNMNIFKVEGKKRPKFIIEDVVDDYGIRTPGRMIWCSLSIWSYHNPYDFTNSFDEIILEHKNGDRWNVFDCRIAPIDEVIENEDGSPALNHFCVVFSRIKRLKSGESRK